ncbi:MAG TPA: single-stranded DNA-binding protein, partial [Mycobacterium sp.]|nr:single-stranded DNA-binding protein [Mycobacterium sp.]
MFETPLTVVGNVVNDPIRRQVGDQEVMKFRVASNSRRRAADASWEPGNSLFVTVNCWGRLVSGVGASLGKGSPVIV